MEFGMNEGSITFEFIHGNYTINVADYVKGIERQPGEYSGIKPEGKISVLIEKHGKHISHDSAKLLATYIRNRIVGYVNVTGSIIDIKLRQHDQFMHHLLNGMNLIIPM